MSDLICGKTAVGGNYNSTRDNKSLLPYYRKLAGENPPNFYDDKKFKYSKYIYALYNNFVKQKNPCFALLNQLVEPYEDNSIAIRLGGPSSVEVYFWLR